MTMTSDSTSGSPAPTPEGEPTPIRPEREASLRFWLLLTGLACLWGHFTYQVHYHWGDESYYNFGWSVPFLAAFLIYNRLEWIPLPPLAFPHGRTGSVVLILAALLGVFLLTPVKIIAEVSVFWRVPLFAQAALLLLITAGIIWATFGSRAFRVFAFPLVFVLTMLPWPYRIEVTLIHGLAQQVTNLTAAIITLIGYPAQAVGNVIQFGELAVGVDDACSGIRSLQALFMAALFVGDYFLLSVFRRSVLLAFGAALVFFFNTFRATVLTAAYMFVGEDFYNLIHDPLGLVTFGLSLAALFGVALLLSSRVSRPDPGVWKQNLASISLPNAVRDRDRPATAASGPPSLLPAIALVAAAVGSIILVESWFRLREPAITDYDRWTLEPVEGYARRLTFPDIPPLVDEVLGYDYMQRMLCLTPDGATAEVYFYGYTGEDRMTSVSTYGHAPTICLGATGATLEREYLPLSIKTGPVELSLKHFKFALNPSRGGGSQHVLWGVFERNNRGVDVFDQYQFNYATLFRQALLGRRDYSRKVILLAYAGVNDPDRVRRHTRRLLEEWVATVENPSQGTSP